MPRKLNEAPKYAPNAIATSRGWIDPATGELLVSVKGLEVKANKAKKAPEKKAEHKAKASPKAEEKKEAEVVVDKEKQSVKKKKK